MKKIKIKLRSVVYSFVAMLAGGTLYFMVFMQVPEPLIVDALPQEQVEKPGENRLEDYPEDIPFEESSGIEMSGYILGDNSYQIKEEHVSGYIEKNVFRYGRLNPMGLKSEEPTSPEPGPYTEETEVPEKEEEKEEENEEGSTDDNSENTDSAGGIVIKLPNNEEISLEYSSGVLPVSDEFYDVSRIYGMDGAEFHYGIDISKEGIEGQEVRTVLPGIVSIVGTTDEFGNYIVVNHGTVSSLYAHLREKPLLSINERVYTGDKLGYVGATGKTEQPQLHFEMDKDGVRFNPESFFKAAIRE